MTEGGVTILALFEEESELAQAASRLELRDVREDHLSVLSDVAHPRGVFPVGEPSVPLQWFSVAGGALGILAGLALTMGTSYLYPIRTGHMPIYSLPPYGIIAYEAMMLSTILATIGVFSGLIVSQWWYQGKTLYDSRIHEGYVGLLVYCPGETERQTVDSVLTDLDEDRIRLARGNHL
ncbi:MAG: quinol:electron acceptor oxidoreductase subunit ActD [bacterium]